MKKMRRKSSFIIIHHWFRLLKPPIFNLKNRYCIIYFKVNPLFRSIKVFSQRRQGILIVKYPLYERHERRRDGTVDPKKFKKANPHVV